MMAPLLLKLIFPAPPSLLINAFSVVWLISSANLGLPEKRGKEHWQYSKFWNSNSQIWASTRKKTRLPSRTGMLFLYVPAFLAPLMSLVPFPHEDIRVLLLSSALAIHFFKRVFEVFIFFFLIKHLLMANINVFLFRFLVLINMEHKCLNFPGLDLVLLMYILNVPLLLGFYKCYRLVLRSLTSKDLYNFKSWSVLWKVETIKVSDLSFIRVIHRLRENLC